METDAPREARNTPQKSRARQANGRVPKLRASCDHCSNAKVRCDQDRPSCQRCLYANNPCNYSASKRMGKPSLPGQSRNGKFKTTTPVRRNSKAESCCTDTNSENSDDQKENAQQPPDTDLGSYGQDFDFSAAWNDANFMADLSGSPNFANFCDPQTNASHLTQTHLNTLPNSDQLNLAASFQDNANPNSNCIRVGAGQYQQISPNILASSNIMSDQPSATCLELASSTLHGLSLPSSICTSSPHATPCHTVEQVLATSRSAISAFNQLLQCPCSRSNSFALTLALIISKILDCYSAISTSSPTSYNMLPITPPSTNGTEGRKTPSGRNLSTSSSAPAFLTNLSPLGSSSAPIPKGPHNMVLDTPIAIGGCQIDAADEHVFILQLVLSELRKVGKLVDAFATQFSSSNPHTCGFASTPNKTINGRSNCGEDSVYKSLEHFLRCQVHKARREVDEVLRRSEEGA